MQNETREAPGFCAFQGRLLAALVVLRSIRLENYDSSKIYCVIFINAHAHKAIIGAGKRPAD